MKEKTKNRILGILIVLIGIALLVLSGWLFTRVWGTALLYTDSVLGKIAAYYWIVLIAAITVIILGVLRFRKKVAEQKPEEPKTEEQRPEEQRPEEKKPEVQVPVSVDAADDDETEIGPAEESVVSEPEKTDPNVCPGCGAALKEGMKFCTKCGHKL